METLPLKRWMPRFLVWDFEWLWIWFQLKSGLCAGNKSSQKKDISRAIKYWREYQERKDWKSEGLKVGSRKSEVGRSESEPLGRLGWRKLRAFHWWACGGGFFPPHRAHAIFWRLLTFRPSTRSEATPFDFSIHHSSLGNQRRNWTEEWRIIECWLARLGTFNETHHETIPRLRK